MGALRRAARYLMRKPGKTAILVLIVFAASFSSMASAGIIETTAALSSDIKSQAMPSVGVYRDDGGLLGQDVADTLRAMRGVESCNRMGQLDAFPDGFSAIGSAVPDPGWEGAVRVNAYDDLSQGSPFEGQLLRLTEGRLFEPGDAGVVLIHSDLAEANGRGRGRAFGGFWAKGRRHCDRHVRRGRWKRRRPGSLYVEEHVIQPNLRGYRHGDGFGDGRVLGDTRRSPRS